MIKFIRPILTLCITMVTLVGYGQVRSIPFEELRSIIKTQDDTLRVINFWATWCKPCVAELPEFENLAKSQLAKDRKLKVILVSLDFAEKLEERVIPFIRKKAISSEVLLLDDVDYDRWIGEIYPTWSGAIPATLFVNNAEGIYEFEEKAFSTGELSEKVSQLPTSK